MKKAKAFSIDINVYEQFQKITKEQGLIMSVLIENYMKKFIKEHENKDM